MQTPEQLDKTLLARLQKGDVHAFAAVYERYKQPMALRLLQLVRNDSYAEELLQDLFMKVWEHRDQINPELSFKAYLYRIATNMAFNFMHRANKERDILERIIRSSTELYDHIETKLLNKENQLLMARLLDGLPVQCRSVFTAVRLDGLSHKEVAELFGISVHTVNNHVQKASKYLKSYLTSPGEMPLLIALCLFF